MSDVVERVGERGHWPRTVVGGGLKCYYYYIFIKINCFSPLALVPYTTNVYTQLNNIIEYEVFLTYSQCIVQFNVDVVTLN